ncbi:Holliday junction resolvase RecU [Guggenheimella bovis]
MAWRTTGLKGDLLENLVNLTNDFYREHHFARVDKIATPVKVVDINEQKQVTMGYFDRKSTVDYIGVSQGLSLCFDAKETNTMNLPLSNIHSHQIACMQDYREHGGISFLIVYWKKVEEFYLVPLELIEDIIEENERKSIPYEAMKDAIRIDFYQGKYLNYLAAVNVYLEKLENKDEDEDDYLR